MNIDEIAMKAGVSRGTVSRVINNAPHVKEQTRQHVLQIIEQFNYIPSAAARSLATRRTMTIGVLVYNVTRPFWGNIIAGIECGIEDNTYDLFLVNSKPHESEWDYGKIYKTHIRNLVKHGVDGMIIALLNDIDQEDIDFIRAADIPVVVIQNGFEKSDIPSVNVDNVAGAKMATEYLIGLGHRRIYHVTGSMLSGPGRERCLGFLEAMENAGLEVPDSAIVQGGHTFHDGYEAMKKILLEQVRPSGVFFSCDEAAYGGMLAARECNLCIPEDISIIGYDGIETQADIAKLLPRLTTMRQPVSEAGKIAAQMIIDRLNGEELKVKVQKLQTVLVEGDTCADLNVSNCEL